MGIRYLVGGSLASSLYGSPRSTQDADLVAALTRGQVDVLVQALCEDFYHVSARAAQASRIVLAQTA